MNKTLETLGVVNCTECKTRIEIYNPDHMRNVELMCPELNIFYCSSKCRIKAERREEGYEEDYEEN